MGGLMRKIYFLRHSIRDQSVHDEKAPLTTRGKQLANDLVPYFSDKKIQFLFSSPFQRTMETIKPVGRHFNLPIVEHDGLRERKNGEWLTQDFDRYTEKQWMDFDFKLKNGESLNEVKERIVPTFYEILTQTTGNGVVCGHGTAFSVLFNTLTNQSFGYQEFLTMKMPDVFLGTFDNQQQFISFENIKLDF
jgi:2,3-bisphosphoglycerate-dependent phosphoglycerate mutase